MAGWREEKNALCISVTDAGGEMEKEEEEDGHRSHLVEGPRKGADGGREAHISTCDERGRRGKGAFCVPLARKIAELH